MLIREIIEEKKKGLSLTKEEIDFLIYEYSKGRISNGRMLDFLRLIDEHNFTYEETFYLANALASTGKRLDVAKNLNDEVVIDKHSAGSMSDPVTLIFMSVLATIGVKNVKVLSNAFGDYKSSLDRFKVFKGFDAKISIGRLLETIKKHGAGVIEETGQIAPIDKQLYKLRKKYGISSVPLVASSILSKKIATGANVLVFDVKAGEGAIVPTLEFSYKLSEYLVNTAKIAGFKAASVITSSDEPLGSALGSEVEIMETMSALKGQTAMYDSKLIDVAKELVVVSLMLAGITSSRAEASKKYDEAIASGKAYDKFIEFVASYGGKLNDEKSITELILSGSTVSYITSNEEGYVSDIVIDKLVESIKKLSYYNTTMLTKKYDKSAGFVLLIREGMKVKKADKLIRIFYNVKNNNFNKVYATLKNAIHINKVKPKTSKVFYKVVL